MDERGGYVWEWRVEDDAMMPSRIQSPKDVHGFSGQTDSLPLSQQWALLELPNINVKDLISVTVS